MPGGSSSSADIRSSPSTSRGSRMNGREPKESLEPKRKSNKTMPTDKERMIVPNDEQFSDPETTTEEENVKLPPENSMGNTVGAGRNSHSDGEESSKEGSLSKEVPSMQVEPLDEALNGNMNLQTQPEPPPNESRVSKGAFSSPRAKPAPPETEDQDQQQFFETQEPPSEETENDQQQFFETQEPPEELMVRQDPSSPREEEEEEPLLETQQSPLSTMRQLFEEKQPEETQPLPPFETNHSPAASVETLSQEAGQERKLSHVTRNTSVGTGRPEVAPVGVSQAAKLQYNKKQKVSQRLLMQLLPQEPVSWEDDEENSQGPALSEDAEQKCYVEVLEYVANSEGDLVTVGDLDALPRRRQLQDNKTKHTREAQDDGALEKNGVHQKKVYADAMVGHVEYDPRAWTVDADGRLHRKEKISSGSDGRVQRLCRLDKDETTKIDDDNDDELTVVVRERSLPPPSRGSTQVAARQRDRPPQRLAAMTAGEQKAQDDVAPRVGREYQAEILSDPKDFKPTSSDLYAEQIWDPKLYEEAVARGEDLSEFCEDKYELNVATMLMEALHLTSYSKGQGMRQYVDLLNQRPGAMVKMSGEQEKVFKELCGGTLIGVKKDFQKAAELIGCRKESVLVHYYRWKSESRQKYAAKKRERNKEPDYCVICDDGGHLIMCEHCRKAFHLECANPPLSKIPEGDWYCSSCERKSPAQLRRWTSHGHSLDTSPRSTRAAKRALESGPMSNARKKKLKAIHKELISPKGLKAGPAPAGLVWDEELGYHVSARKEGTDGEPESPEVGALDDVEEEEDDSILNSPQREDEDDEEEDSILNSPQNSDDETGKKDVISLSSSDNEDSRDSSFDEADAAAADDENDDDDFGAGDHGSALEAPSSSALKAPSSFALKAPTSSMHSMPHMGDRGIRYLALVPITPEGLMMNIATGEKGTPGTFFTGYRKMRNGAISIIEQNGTFRSNNDMIVNVDGVETYGRSFDEVRELLSRRQPDQNIKRIWLIEGKTVPSNAKARQPIASSTQQQAQNMNGIVAAQNTGIRHAQTTNNFASAATAPSHGYGSTYPNVNALTPYFQGMPPYTAALSAANQAQVPRSLPVNNQAQHSASEFNPMGLGGYGSQGAAQQNPTSVKNGEATTNTSTNGRSQQNSIRSIDLSDVICDVPVNELLSFLSSCGIATIEEFLSADAQVLAEGWAKAKNVARDVALDFIGACRLKVRKQQSP